MTVSEKVQDTAINPKATYKMAEDPWVKRERNPVDK